MIHFICGRPRGGKSLFAAHRIVEVLLEDREKVIQTNMPMNMGELRAYFQERFPDREIDVQHRVLILNDETETARFYLVRPWGYRVDDVSKQDEKEGKRLDFSKCRRVDKSFDLLWFEHKTKTVRTSVGFAPRQLCRPVTWDRPGVDWVQVDEPEFLQASALPPVFGVIDELHNFFGARDWAEVGKGCIFYLSQHAKLGDTLLCVTQAEKNVDRQFRSVAQDFTYVRNYGKEKYGIFKKPSVFLRTTFMEPRGMGTSQEALETKTVHLDVGGICKLYDTASGVGISGVAADTEEKTKGVHVSWLIAAVGLVMVGLMCMPNLLSRAILKATASPVVKQQTNQVPVRAPVMPAVRPGPGSGLGVVRSPVEGLSSVVVAPGGSHVVNLRSKVAEVSKTVFYAGWSQSGTNPKNYYLSDGQVIVEGETGFEGGSDRWVRFAGVMYRLKPWGETGIDSKREIVAK